MKKRKSSVKPSQLRNLSRVTTFSDTIYFPFIFSRFSLYFDIFNFLETNRFTFVPEYFPAETIFSNVFTKFSRISPRNNISEESVSKTFFVPSSERNVSRKYSSEFPNFLRIKRFNVQITQTNKYNNDNERMEKNIQLQNITSRFRVTHYPSLSRLEIIYSKDTRTNIHSNLIKFHRTKRSK